MDANTKMKVLAVVPVADKKTTDIFAKHEIEVLHVGHPSIFGQLNAGFGALDAEFIQIAASDDYLYPNMLATFYAAARAYGSDIVYSAYEVWNGEGLMGYAGCDGNFEKLHEACFVSDECMIRRAAWAGLGGFDESLWRYAAWDFFIRAYRNKARYLYLPFFGFRYYSHGKQVSQKQRRGEHAKRDAEAYAAFKAKNGIEGNPVTYGHGADMRVGGEVVPTA